MTFPTEAERQARLHKRAGCDCTEEGIMSDPTPEERAKRVWRHADDDRDFYAAIEFQIRAAAAAEREACVLAVDDACALLGCTGDTTRYIMAAIRARGESE
jgi:hypothetical protein